MSFGEEAVLITIVISGGEKEKKKKGSENLRNDTKIIYAIKQIVEVSEP